MIDRDVQARLQDSVVFPGVDLDDLRQIMPRLNVLSFPRGRVIFSQGQPAAAFFVIVEGWVRLMRKSDGAEPVTIHVFGPGETFAEALIMPGAVYPVSAETLTKVRLVRIDSEAYRTLIATQPRMALAVITSNFAKMKGLMAQVERLKGWTLKRRVAEAVLRFCPAESGAVTFDFPFERAIIAQMLGISAATLSRAFPELASIGVHVTREQIAVDDVGKLATYVQAGRLTGVPAK
jgi:CRP-like cAMP-binding protein